MIIWCRLSTNFAQTSGETHEEDHGEEKPGGHEHREEKEPSCEGVSTRWYELQTTCLRQSWWYVVVESGCGIASRGP